jgi:Conjugative transposon protein TcpC
MSSFWTIARKVLNLESKPPPDASAVGRGFTAPSPGLSATPQPAANPWEKASQRLQHRQQTASTPPREPGVPWVVHDEKSFSVFARQAGRIALRVLVGLALLIEFRLFFFPTHVKVPTPAPSQAGPSYPVQQAQQVASRWSIYYLTWDQANPNARAQQLAMDMPSGADTSIGWDGHGKQSVVYVLPGAVTVGAQGRARVAVDVLVDPGGKPGGAAQWVGLDVPVMNIAGRIVVTGEPGLIGLPSSGPAVPAASTPPSDAGFSSQTQSTVEAFFKAYASGSASSMSGVTAPGAVIPPLPSGMTFGQLSSWSVDAGSGSNRTGTAVVTWQLAGAQLEQTYRVNLTEVSSAAATTWQVASVHGGSQ